MKSNHIFIECFCLSLAFHTAFFAITSLPHPALIKLPKKPIEVSYVQNAGQKETTVTSEQHPKTPRENPSSKIETVKIENPLRKTHHAVQDFIKNTIPIETPLPKPFAEKDQFPPRRSITLPAVPGETAKTPEYRNYYQVIREKIRRLAYRHYKKLDEGEVYLTFTLTPDGNLVEAVINNKSLKANDYLRDIALKSVTNAAPYPEFPEKLKTHRQLTFHVIISFELK